MFAAAVPSSPRISFRIFVRQNRTLSLHDRAAREIFRRYQFDIFELPLSLVLYRLKNGGIHLLEGTVSWMAHRLGITSFVPLYATPIHKSPNTTQPSPH